MPLPPRRAALGAAAGPPGTGTAPGAGGRPPGGRGLRSRRPRPRRRSRAVAGPGEPGGAAAPGAPGAGGFPRQGGRGEAAGSRAVRTAAPPGEHGGRGADGFGARGQVTRRGAGKCPALACLRDLRSGSHPPCELGPSYGKVLLWFCVALAPMIQTRKHSNDRPPALPTISYHE